MRLAAGYADVERYDEWSNQLINCLWGVVAMAVELLKLRHAMDSNHKYMRTEGSLLKFLSKQGPFFL